MIEIKLNDNQKPFFEKIEQYDIVVDSGTWRSGKSFELCLFMILRMKKYPGIREFLGRLTLKSIMETTFNTFLEILTEKFKLVQGRDFKVKYSPPSITFPNKSKCIFGDIETKSIGKWLSSEYSDIGIDEAQQISRISFEKIKSRQTQTIIEKLSGGRSKNKFIMAMNPPETAESHWTHTVFRNPKTKIKNSAMIYSHIENNRDNIPKDYIEDMRASVDKRTASIYLDGLWIPLLSNVVYPDYDFPSDSEGYKEGGNLKFLKVNPNLNSYISIDFGWTAPMSIGCWQHDPLTDTFYRLYEVVEPYIKPETYCDLLMGKSIYHNGKTYKLPINVHNSTIIVGFEAEQRRQESEGKSNLMLMKDILKKKGVFPKIYVVTPGIHLSIIAVRSHILTSSGQRKIFIDPRYCTRFIQDCKTYHYPTDLEGNITSEEPEKDGISDHTQDEARYLIWYVSPFKNKAFQA